MTGAGMLMAFLLFAPFFAAATTYTISVSTDKSIYNSGATITVSGSVSPAPPSGTATTLQVKNSGGTLVDFGQGNVGPTGSFSATFVVGASYAPGSYTVTAVWGPNATAPTITGSANFQINGTAPTTNPSGVTTTIFSYVTTTVVQQGVTTTVVQAPVTTTIVSAQQTTVTSVVQQQTTVTQSYTGSDTGTYIGAVGIIIAIIAIVLAVLAMRKK